MEHICHSPGDDEPVMEHVCHSPGGRRTGGWSTSVIPAKAGIQGFHAPASVPQLLHRHLHHPCRRDRPPGSRCGSGCGPRSRRGRRARRAGRPAAGSRCRRSAPARAAARRTGARAVAGQGAQRCGLVGPNTATVGTPVAAARCDTEVSGPTYSAARASRPASWLKSSRPETSSSCGAGASGRSGAMQAWSRAPPLPVSTTCTPRASRACDQAMERLQRPLLVRPHRRRVHGDEHRLQRLLDVGGQGRGRRRRHHGLRRRRRRARARAARASRARHAPRRGRRRSRRHGPAAGASTSCCHGRPAGCRCGGAPPSSPSGARDRRAGRPAPGRRRARARRASRQKPRHPRRGGVSMRRWMSGLPRSMPRVPAKPMHVDRAPAASVAGRPAPPAW